jgi:putative N-acetylmannosamine-6-phosphate epimerase
LAISCFEVTSVQEKSRESAFDRLRGRLIVSCQASDGDPLNDLGTLVRIATAVLRGGAGGLRAEGAERVEAFRGITQLPIIGIVKSFDANGEVYITPDFHSAKAVSDAGADIIALDCTARRLNAAELAMKKAEAWPALIKRIHADLGKSVLADIASVEDAVAAEQAGADAVATTLYGYTAETAGTRTPSWALVERLLRQVKVPVIVEGHITSPGEVRKAFELGAWAVVVGSAITRPETITARFAAAAQQGRRSAIARRRED